MALPIHINTINIGSTFDVRLRYFSNWRFDVVFDPSVHNVERPTHEVAQQKVVFTCIENNLAKFQNGKLPRSFNGFLSKIRDDAETTKYWKLKKQRQNRRFLPRSIDYCVAKDVKLDLRTSGTCFHRHEVACFQFCRAKGGNIINNKRIKNSVATLWSIILRIDDFGENTKILFTSKYTYWTFVSKSTYWHFRKSVKNYFLKIELVVWW